MRIVDIKFAGIDSWCRPRFVTLDKKTYYGDVTCGPDHIKRSDPIAMTNYYKEHLELLEYFGHSFECEPCGGINANIKLNIVDL